MHYVSFKFKCPCLNVTQNDETKTHHYFKSELILSQIQKSQKSKYFFQGTHQLQKLTFDILVICKTLKHEHEMQDEETKVKQ
jgi:hypothetical protein